jgi:hypothetical protein
MKVLLLNFNRLTLPKAMIEWLLDRNMEVIIIDNNSTYPPLLEYYENCGLQVLRMDANYGHTVVWTKDVLSIFSIKGRYIVTDPDLDLNGVPDDFIDVLHFGLDKYKAFAKCGLSLEINDLPNTKEGNFIKHNREKRFWNVKLDNRYFMADIDTTFAMYREGWNKYTLNAIRTNRPYVCRHVPWYYTDFDNLPEDEQFYFKTASDSCSGKKRMLIP